MGRTRHHMGIAWASHGHLAVEGFTNHGLRHLPSLPGTWTEIWAAHEREYTWTYGNIYIHRHTFICLYIHIYIHIYVYIYIYTISYICTYECPFWRCLPIENKKTCSLLNLWKAVHVQYSFGMRISCLFKRMVAVYTPGGLWRVCPLEEQLPKLGKPFPATMKRCETCLNMCSEDLGTLNPWSLVEWFKESKIILSSRNWRIGWYKSTKPLPLTNPSGALRLSTCWQHCTMASKQSLPTLSWLLNDVPLLKSLEHGWNMVEIWSNDSHIQIPGLQLPHISAASVWWWATEKQQTWQPVAGYPSYSVNQPWKEQLFRRFLPCQRSDRIGRFCFL